jgi:predicted NBD/HSP70 family sugar kinase
LRAPDPLNTSEQQTVILRLLREHGALTRRQLSHMTGYSISLVRQLTEALALHALILTNGVAGDVPGRPSQLWSLSPDACLAVGLDVSSRETQVVVLDAHGTLLFRHNQPRREAQTPEGLLQHLLTVARHALDALGERRRFVRGVGVAFGGFVDFNRGVSLDAIDIPHAEALPLQAYLAQNLALPVIPDDRSRAMALAEARYGAARALRDCICVNVSSGIGTGIILDGRLYRGALGLAGELGHIPVIAGGSPCRCGGQGCLETVASGTALETRARALLAEGIDTALRRLSDDPAAVSVPMIVQAAEEGDAVANALLEHAGQWLGMGMATLVNLYACEQIVLTGSVMRGNARLMEIIRREARRYVIRPMRDRFRVALTELDETASAIGAATFVLDAEFERGFTERLLRLQPAADC